MGTEVLVGLALSAAAAGAQMYNTNRTQRKQDAAAADSIRNQARRQREADAKVNEEVQRLQDSNSAAERAKAMESFTQQLRTNRKAIESGLVQGYGSDAFKAAGEQAKQAVGSEAEQSAGLLSRMDAPAYQRMNEGFSRGMLSTDLSQIARAADGQEFLDRLRINAIRRNPWIDAAAGVAGGYASTLAGGFGKSSNASGANVEGQGVLLPSQGGGFQAGPWRRGYQYDTKPWWQTGPGGT